MKFDLIKKLSNLELIKGIEFCCSNSNELFESALILKSQKKFGTSISLAILSIEEIIKAQTLFTIMTLEDSERENCRELFESTDLHKSRNKFALFFNELFKLINNAEIKVLEVNFNGNEEHLAEYLLKERVLEQGFINTEKEKATSKNWFSHAHQTKNNGLYVDYNKKWFSPKRFTEKDCEKAFNEIDLIKKNISFTLEFMINNQNNIDDIVTELKGFAQKFYKN